MNNYVNQEEKSLDEPFMEDDSSDVDFDVKEDVNQLTKKISTYEQTQSAVKVDLDKYANIIKETDLKVSQFRDQIINKIDQITSRFKEAKIDGSVSQEELNKLSKDIQKLNISLTGIEKDDAHFSQIRKNINLYKSQLDKLCAQQSIVIGKLEQLTQREVALSSQNDELSSLEIFRIKRKLKQIRSYRNSLEKKMDSLAKKINDVKKKLESNFQQFDKYKKDFDNTYSSYNSGKKNDNTQIRQETNDNLNAPIKSIPVPESNKNGNKIKPDNSVVGKPGPGYNQQVSPINNNYGKPIPGVTEFFNANKSFEQHPTDKNYFLPKLQKSSSILNEMDKIDLDNPSFGNNTNNFSKTKINNKSIKENVNIFKVDSNETYKNKRLMKIQDMSQNDIYKFQNNFPNNQQSNFTNNLTGNFSNVPQNNFPNNLTNSFPPNVPQNNFPNNNLTNNFQNIPQNNFQNFPQPGNFPNRTLPLNNNFLNKKPFDISYSYPHDESEDFLRGIDEIDFSPESLQKYRPDFLKDPTSKISTNDVPIGEPTSSHQIINNELQKNQQSFDNSMELPNPIPFSDPIRPAPGVESTSYLESSTSEIDPSTGGNFIEELKKRLVFCQNFLQTSNINSEIVTRFIKELNGISSYFDSVIFEFQKSFGMIVVFKNDISKLLPNKKKINEGFTYFGSEINLQKDRVKKEYENFSALYAKFRGRFSFYKKQVFSGLDVFNSFSSDLKDVIVWVKETYDDSDTLFYVDCNGMLEFWMGLNDRYSCSWANISNIEAFLTKATSKISLKIENLQVVLWTVSKRVETAIVESDHFIEFWDEVTKQLDKLFESVKEISRSVVNRVRDLSISFDKTITTFEKGINTDVIEAFNNSLDVFYGAKNDFENQIKEFQLRYVTLQNEYEKFLLKRKFMLESENDLYLLIDDVKHKQELLFELLRQFYVDLDNNLLSLDIFIRRILDDQGKLFMSYDTFVSQYPNIKNYILAKKEEKTAKMGGNDGNAYFAQQQQQQVLQQNRSFNDSDDDDDVYGMQMQNNNKPKLSYADVMRELQEKNDLFLKMLTEYNQNK